MPDQSRTLRHAAFLACFVVAAAAIRIGLVAACANSIPYSDEWIAAIDTILRPLATGHFTLLDLFRSHNEHTIAPTRLVALVELWLNHGQFDNVPVALFNALIYAGAMALPICLFFRHASGPTRLFAVVLGLAALAPLEGEDLIFGFQNQYYFLIAGTTATLWLAATLVSTSKRSIAGFAAVAFATCVSMGSGFFAPALAVLIGAVRWRLEPQHRRVLMRCMLVGAALAIFGFALLLHAFAVMRQVGIVGEKHIDLDGIRRVFSCLAWPYGTSAWLGFVLALPFAAFVIRLIWRRQPIAPLDLLACALGLWAGAQICALAFDRHSEATFLASRYLPVILFWPAMNVYALFRLSDAVGPMLRSRPAVATLSLLPVLAGAALISNVARFVPVSMVAMATASEQHQWQAEHVARYVRLGQADAIYGAGHMQLPYPNRDKLRSLLDDPAVRSGLPANMRAPMVLAAAANEPTVFVPFGAYPSVPRRDDLPGFGSFGEAGNPATGAFHSAPLHTGFPYVRIDLAGYLPDPGLSLQLECAAPATCAPSAIRPAQFARETWHGLYVKVPGQEFRVAANDQTKTLWMAFTAPIEVGRLSVLSDALINRLRTDAYTCISLLCGILSLLFLIGLWPVGAWRQPAAEA